MALDYLRDRLALAEHRGRERIDVSVAELRALLDVVEAAQRMRASYGVSDGIKTGLDRLDALGREGE